LLYPGKQDSTYVMRLVGNNIRLKWVLLRSSFKNARNKESVPCSGSCFLESWNLIYESLSNVMWQAKSKKCKVEADARTYKLKFAYKLGPRGVGGLVTKFVSPSIAKLYKLSLLISMSWEFIGITILVYPCGLVVDFGI
jgi:hypothetical protein